MARTKQTARRATRDPQDQVPDEEEQQEMTAHLTEEDKARRMELEKAPMQAELKHLEKRWTKKGTGYITEPKEDEDIPDQKVNWHEKFALCIMRTYDQSNEWVQQTTLQVNSEALKDLLHEIIGYYPGQSFSTTDVNVDFPAHALYHYRPELTAALEREDLTADERAHLRILLDFISDHFADEIKDGDNLREQGLVSYKHLWTIFKPGSLIFGSMNGQQRVFRLSSYYYSGGNCPCLMLSGECVNFDGDNFGTQGCNLRVFSFEGAQPIAGLSAFPLSMHPEKELITTAITERGRRWEALAGQNFMQYKGVAFDKNGSRFNIDGRVMVDTQTYHRLEADNAFSVNAFPRLGGGLKRKQAYDSDDWDLVSDDTSDGNLAPLTDEQCLLASPMVRGFAFTEKTFLEFFVDKLSPIEWNTKCFEQLVLPDHQKELVQALVAEHTERATAVNAGFDDIVKGKGQGLILVLHGPPGVGKTLTAECVAEFSRRPLYIVSSGDLGTSSTVLDQKLSRCLDLASTWKAVLLIDEADVFLERRSLHDMERNSLVSIFLRTLEYYSGILFMTTNRVSTFDDAFKSRIHVPLKYESLPASSRVKVWKNFLGPSEAKGGIEIDEAGYRELAKGELNGRQIKNVVRTAKSLAAYKKRKLDQKQLMQVMEIQMAFEEEMNQMGAAVVDRTRQ